MPDNGSTLALLIDGDNASPKIVSGLLAEVAKYGVASVRRIYGDFSSPRSKGWADVLQKYAIDPHQQFAYTTGKNASDIALVIDAMERQMLDPAAPGYAVLDRYVARLIDVLDVVTAIVRLMR